MGCGKSTIGKLLAEELKYKFLDLDNEIQNHHGLSVNEAILLFGENEFRTIESKILETTLGNSNIVVSLGGGTLTKLWNRTIIRRAINTATVFLDASFDTILTRCSTQDIIRPNLVNIVEAEKLYNRRQPIYRGFADVTVSTDNETEQVIITKILDQFEIKLRDEYGYSEQSVRIAYQ